MTPEVPLLNQDEADKVWQILLHYRQGNITCMEGERELTAICHTVINRHCYKSNIAT